MVDVSNKTMALILVAALMVSFGGTLMSLNAISKVKVQSITAFAAGDLNRSYGNVSLIISDITWLNFTTKSIDFGTGTVLSNGGVCSLNSSGYENNTGGCSSTWANNAGGGLVVKNIGNNNVSLNLTWRNYTQFFTKENATSKIAFKLINGVQTIGTNPGCKGQTMTYFNKFNNTWQQVGRKLWHSNITCDNMYYGSTAHSITIHVKLSIPANGQALTGTRRNVLMAVGKAI